MVTEIDGNTLKIRYANNVSFNFGSISGKDLIIIVPRNWNCRALVIDGAALDISVEGLKAENVELNGASTKFSYNGFFSDLECNGAAAKLDVTCTGSPAQISVDGAACEMNLTLPKNCGFIVDADGLAIDFDSSLDYSKNGDTYTYGNEKCEIDISGLGCRISVEPS